MKLHLANARRANNFLLDEGLYGSWATNRSTTSPKQSGLSSDVGSLQHGQHFKVCRQKTILPRGVLVPELLAYRVSWISASMHSTGAGKETTPSRTILLALNRPWNNVIGEY